MNTPPWGRGLRSGYRAGRKHNRSTGIIVPRLPPFFLLALIVELLWGDNGHDPDGIQGIAVFFILAGKAAAGSLVSHAQRISPVYLCGK